MNYLFQPVIFAPLLAITGHGVLITNFGFSTFACLVSFWINMNGIKFQCILLNLLCGLIISIFYFCIFVCFFVLILYFPTLAGVLLILLFQIIGNHPYYYNGRSFQTEGILILEISGILGLETIPNNKPSKYTRTVLIFLSGNEKTTTIIIVEIHYLCKIILYRAREHASFRVVMRLISFLLCDATNNCSKQNHYY
uniref:Uncharacterized protein n=1 Tax=Heterorhabditis bacteriophora TaxID=37862 RepID=A0A1I7W639_HETBA